MGKGIFDGDFSEMMELDKEFDINAVLEGIPAVDDELQDPPEKEGDDKDKDENLLKDINKVLETQTTEGGDDPDEDEGEEDIKKDDEAPASLATTTDTSSDAPFTVIFARDLVEQGLLSSLDEQELLDYIKEHGEADALRGLIKGEIEANINAAKEDLDAGYQQYLTLIGKGVSHEAAGNLMDLKERFGNIKSDDLEDESNETLRRQVITDYYKLTTAMSDNKIDRLVQTSIDMGDDVEDAKEFLGILNKAVADQIKEEENQAAERNRLLEEENRRSIETLKNSINSLGEIVPGVSINKQTKKQMFEAITKPVQDSKGRTTNAIWAKRAEDPMFFDERLSYLLTTGFFEKGKTWTKAAQSKVTKEITKLEEVLKSKSNQSKIGTPVIQSPGADKTSRDNIESMRGIFS